MRYATQVVKLYDLWVISTSILMQWHHAGAFISLGNTLRARQLGNTPGMALLRLEAEVVLPRQHLLMSDQEIHRQAQPHPPKWRNTREGPTVIVVASDWTEPHLALMQQP